MNTNKNGSERRSAGWRINWLFEIERRIRTCVIIVLLLVILGLFADIYWLFDAFTHFKIQYAVCLFIAAVVLCILKNFKWAAVSAFTGFILAIWTSPYWYAYAATHAEGEHSLLVYNIRTGNEQYENVINFLRKSDADFALIMEINADWENRLEDLEDVYPYKVSRSREDNFGILLLSQYPLVASEVRAFGGIQIPSIVAEIALPAGETLHLVGTHSVPPYGSEQTAMRDKHLKDIAAYCRKLNKRHMMVAGDLNLTPFSPKFDRVLMESRLLDSGRGIGWQPTWFSKMPWFAIPIDHILVSGGVEVTHRSLGSTMGSDHNPIVIRFNTEDLP